MEIRGNMIILAMCRKRLNGPDQRRKGPVRANFLEGSKTYIFSWTVAGFKGKGTTAKACDIRWSIGNDE